MSSSNMIKHYVEKIRDDFLSDVDSVVEINMGSCKDFVDVVSRDILNEEGVEVICTGTEYFWSEDGIVDSEAQARRNLFELPDGLNWSILEDIDFNDNGYHCWIEYDGLCYDAETIDGVKSPFDLPSIRHALIEMLEHQKPELLNLVIEKYDWWKNSKEIMLKRNISIECILQKTSFKN